MSDTSLVFNIIAKDKASAVFDKMKVGAALAGAAIGAALAAGVASAIDKSKTDALLAAQLGAGPVFSQNLGKLSGSLYAKGFGEDIAGVNAALKAAFQSGLAGPKMAQKDVEAVTGKVMNLAAVMEEDSGRVSAAVSTMLRTGMAKSAEEAFDILHKGAEGVANQGQDLLDVYTEYPVQFQKLGLSGTQALGLINQSIKAGAYNADTAGDALKEFAIRGADGSKTSAEGFKAIGLNAKKMTADIASGGPRAQAALQTVLQKFREMEDPVKRDAATVALFGGKSEDLQKALLGMDLSKAEASIGAVAGSAKRAGDTLANSAGAKLDVFKRKAQMALVDQLGKAVPHIEKVFGFLARNVDVVKAVGAALGVLAVTVGTIMIATKVWAGLQIVWGAATGIATAAQWALNIAMTANPIGLIIAGVILLIGVIVLIATKTTWFQTAWKYTWNAIKAAAAAVGNWFAGPFAGFFVGLWNKIVSGVRGVKNWIVGSFNSVVGFVASIPSRIGAAASGMWDGIKNAFKGAVNWIIGRWNGLSFGIPKITVAGMSFGGQSFRVPQIPYLAKGGTITGAGMAVVGEAGPELVSLSRGAQVTPLTRSGRSSSGEQVLTARYERSGDKLIDALMESLRFEIRRGSGGDVQAALGQR